MERTSTIVVLTAAATALLLWAGAVPAQLRGKVPHPDRHVQGRVLVQPRPGVSLAELDNIVKGHGGKRGEAIKQINVHVIELPPQAKVLAVVEALRKNRNLKFAEADGVLSPDFTPNDPRYSSAWHLPKINAPGAWDSAQGTGVTIAILDTGIDSTHPDLSPQLVPGWNFFDNNNNVADVHGHGTNVAGVAAAAGNNAIGVTSVGYRAKIMPLRVTDTSGNGFFSLMASALTWAADNGARVANISFLGVSLSASVDSAAQYMRSKGGVVVTGSGNTGGLRTDPPTPSMTVVAATDSNDAKASFSSWGDYVDIAAPGVSIWTTWQGGVYAGMSGTSASSPVVAGVYALMMSAKPGLAPATYDSILFSTAQDLGGTGWDQQFGHGRVNAAAAVSSALATTTTDSQPPTVAIASPSGGKISGLVPVDTTATDNVAVARVELLANGTVVATDTSAPFGMSLDTSKYPDGNLNLQAKAYDAAGNAASSSTVTVTVANDTVAPTVSITNPAAGSTVSGTVAVSISATDNQKVSKISLTIDGKEVAVSYGSTLSYSWAAPKPKGKGSASSTISARAEDPAGNYATRSITVNRK
jgi:hypothetical protein